MGLFSRLKDAFDIGTFVRRDEDGERFNIILGSDFAFGKDGKKSGINEGFKLNSYIYSIIHRIATTAADIPIEVVRKLPSGEEELVNDGDFYDLVHRPNKTENWASMLYQSLVFQLANGNSFEYIVIPTGFQFPDERYNLFPQYVTIKAEEVFYGYEPKEFKYKFSENTYKYTPEEVLHIKRFNPTLSADNPCYGLSPLTAAYRTMVASNEIQVADASLIKNRGVSGLLTHRGNRPLTESEKTMATKALRNRIGGGSKFGGVSVTSGQFDLINFALSPSDLQILESRVIKLRDLCSVFGVSSRMFNDPNGTTFNNVKEDNKKYYELAVLPPLKIYIDNFNEFYSPLYKKATGEDVYVRYNAKSIMALQEDELRQVRKNESKLKAIQNILTGISKGTWTVESGVSQLMYSHDMTEDEAITLINNEAVTERTREEE